MTKIRGGDFPSGCNTGNPYESIAESSLKRQEGNSVIIVLLIVDAEISVSKLKASRMKNGGRGMTVSFRNVGAGC